jgi:hypothetical protein
MPMKPTALRITNRRQRTLFSCSFGAARLSTNRFEGLAETETPSTPFIITLILVFPGQI